MFGTIGTMFANLTDFGAGVKSIFTSSLHFMGLERADWSRSPIDRNNEHEVDQPIEFFRELNRILQTDGRLVVIEWVKASTEMGPPLEHRLSIQQLDDWALTTGFIKVKSWQWLENFIGIEYCKKP